MIDAQGNVKIMDFGIARSMEAATRLTGSMVGTPAYMAPEQVAGKPVDYRTDIYSLGLIMYEVFTGTQAFQAENAVAVALKQMRESPIPPHEIEPMIPVAIERAILKCLEKEQSRRFQSILELENALHEPAGSPAPATRAVATAILAAHGDVLAKPFYSPPESASKRPSALVWVFLLALLLGGAAVAWRSVQITQAADNLAPPDALPAPKPPDFSLQTNAQQPIAASPAVASDDASAVDGHGAPTAKTERIAKAEPAPNDPAPAKREPVRPFPALAARIASQRADLAPVATPSPAAPQNAQSGCARTASRVTSEESSCLLIARFMRRRSRAECRDENRRRLGFPVIVIPRRNPKKANFLCGLSLGRSEQRNIRARWGWLDEHRLSQLRQIAVSRATRYKNLIQNP